jgi:hypothetical protein
MRLAYVRDPDTVEYVKIEMTADVELDAQPVSIAAHPYDSTEDPTWHAATWLGTVGKIRSAGVLFGPGAVAELDEGDYLAMIKVTDSPEIPVKTGYVFRVLR